MGRNVPTVGEGAPDPLCLPRDFLCTHNSLMRMSGTQMLSTGREICVRLSKRAGSHLRNSSVQCWGQWRGDLVGEVLLLHQHTDPSLAPSMGGREDFPLARTTPNRAKQGA